MAVLKDLIVHGPSHFIGTSYINILEANKIRANEGIFTKLAAKNASVDETLTVNGLLDVYGELHTKSWSNSNIATVDGNLHIVPTITAATASGTITYSSSAYSMSITGAFATNTLTIGTSTTIVAWTPGSKLIVSGEVLVNNEWLPLGTLKCDLGGSANLATDAASKTIPLTAIKDGTGNTSGVLEAIRTTLNLSGTSSTLQFRNVKIAFYSRKNTNMYPIGILLTAQGTGASKTFIDMYNGNNAASGTYGGLALPVVRIGNLSSSSLPAVGGQTPTGWGIYTSNGYFTGTIVSTSGTIGNWSITGSSIQTGAFNTAGKMYFGNSGISLGTTFRVTSDGALTATSGTIGGITIGGTYLTTAAARKTYDAATAGLTITSSGIGAGNGTANTFKVVASTGALTASNATLTGGAIAGWTFNTTSLYKTNATPGYSAATMVISTGTKSTYNIGEGGTDEKTWMLSAGRGFGVTTAGKLYATGAVISGVLNITDPEASNIYTISAANEQIKNTQDTVDALRGEVATQAEDIASIQEQSQQFASNTDLQATRGIVDQYLGDNGAIKLDNTGILLSRGQFQLLITSQELDFLDAGQTVASLSNQALNITSAIITSNLTLGPFKWVVSTNRLTLMRI